MKMPFRERPVINMHFMALDTDWVENVGDDNVLMVSAKVDNGFFNRKNKNQIQLWVSHQNADHETLKHGGLVLFTNLKKTTARRALLFGLEYMMRNGQLSKEDFLGDEQDQFDPSATTDEDEGD